jgi:glycosyltransferase involved in cell wall biosynthesis
MRRSNKRINVLYVIDTAGPGGAESVFMDLIIIMNRKNIRPIVIIKSEGWLSTELIRNNIKPYIIPSDGSFNLMYLLKLIRVIKKERIQLIHSHLFGANVYSSVAGLLTKIPVISTFHGANDISPDERLLKVKELILNYGSNKIVAVSQSLLTELLARINLNKYKIEVIYNGVDTVKYNTNKKIKLKKEYGLDNKGFLLGALGNVRKDKSYDVLLEAAHLLSKSDLKFKILVAGDTKLDQGLYANLVSKQVEYGLEDKVEFIGFCDQVIDFLSNLDLFVLSSSSEGFSIATIEAMATGIPVLSTRCGGPEEIIQDGIDGYLVEKNSPAALARKITDCLNDSSNLKLVAIKAKRKVKENFALELMIDNYLNLYEKLLGLD